MLRSLIASPFLRRLGVVETAPGFGIDGHAVCVAADGALVAGGADTGPGVGIVVRDDDFRQRGCASAQSKR